MRRRVALATCGGKGGGKNSTPFKKKFPFKKHGTNYVDEEVDEDGC